MKVKGKNILVLAPKHNTGTKKDATGAFQPEAMAFAKRHRVPRSQVVWIDNHLSKPAMRKAVLAEIEKVKASSGGLQSLAVFCHGWKKGIQFGFNLATVATFAEALADVKDVRVPLYACNTAKGMNGKNSEPVGGDGGFADRLRDALCEAGAVDCCVDAHTTAGHATKNPYVRRFAGMGSPVGFVGGYFLASPTNKKLFAQWRGLLKDSNLRLDFPFMTVAEIHNTIAG